MSGWALGIGSAAVWLAIASGGKAAGHGWFVRNMLAGVVTAILAGVAVVAWVALG